MEQFVISPAAGKRLIAKAALRHPGIQSALEGGTVVIIAGTTNGYVAEEILTSIGQDRDFQRKRFFRGITLPPSSPTTDTGRLPDESEFPGDVVIVNGQWQTGKTIFDVVDQLQAGDVIVKGANAVDLRAKRAGILIGHPQGGTIAAALPAVTGRRVRLILPVGLEKRVASDLDAIAAKLNAPGSKGPRFWPVPGEVLTEIEAVSLLTGATAEVVSAGGVGGAEGSVWLAVGGTQQQEQAVRKVMKDIAVEPCFEI